MGKGDNRRSMKMRRKISWRKKKARDMRKKQSPKAPEQGRTKTSSGSSQS